MLLFFVKFACLKVQKAQSAKKGGKCETLEVLGFACCAFKETSAQWLDYNIKNNKKAATINHSLFVNRKIIDEILIDL